MRRGDGCLLKWQDVDLTRRFITVKSAKTDGAFADDGIDNADRDLKSKVDQLADFCWAR